MNRVTVVFIVLVTLAGIVASGALDRPGPKQARASCALSAIPAVRLVQTSGAFDSAASALAAATYTDSTARAADVRWRCEELRLSSPQDLEELQLVFAPASQDQERRDIVFATDVRLRRVVLLSPWQRGLPTGGLDRSAWNGFVAGGASLPVTTQSRARALACALYRVQDGYFGRAECYLGEQASGSYSTEDSAWVIRVARPAPDTGLVFRISRTGVLR